MGLQPVTNSDGQKGFYSESTGFIGLDSMQKVTNESGEKGYYHAKSGFVPVPTETKQVTQDTGQDLYSKFDTEAKAGRSDLITGAKRGLAKVAGGIGQRLGVYSQQEVDAALSAMDEERKGEGIYGKVGEFAGETAPLMMLPGGQTKGLANLATNVGVGAVTGMIAPTAAGESAKKNAVVGGLTGGVLSGGMQLLGKGAGKAAPALYESAIKIPPSVPYDLRKEAVETGLESGVRISEKGLSTARNIIDGFNKEIKKVVDSGVGDTVDMASVVKRIDSLKDFYKNLPKNTREAFLDELDAIQKKVAEDGFITSQDAQKMKQAIYALHRKHYGELKSLAIEADKAIARGLKEEIVKLYPELKALNKQDSAMINLEDFVERAVNRSRNYDIVRMGDTFISTTGAVLGGAAGAAAAATSKHILEMPAMKSAIAIALKKASKKATGVNTKYTIGAANILQ